MTSPRVVVFGADELGAELVTSFRRLGAEVTALDGAAGPAEVTAVIERVRPDHVVTATDGTPAEILTGTRLHVDREGLRRLAADELGLPTAPFWFAGSLAELTAITEHAGFPVVVKPLVTPPVGGPSVLLRPEDVEPAWHGAVPSGGRGRVLVEMVVDFDHEITILTVRDRDGALTFCEPIGHRQVDGSGDVVLEAWQPQWVSPIATDSAHSIAARVVNALGGSGVYGVELLVHDDEVYFSDVTGYPPGTGLVTLRSQRLSMFDLHARATLGLPVDTIMVSPAAAEVVYADVESEGADREPGGRLIAALSVPESDVRIFSPARGYPRRRRIGLALATGPDVATARDRIRQMSGALHRWWR